MYGARFVYVRMRRAGNAWSAEGVHLKLELKHIQLVSLGWAHTARVAPACVPTRALQLLTDVRAFHTHHAKDVSPFYLTQY